MTDAELDALCNKLRSDVIALMDVRVAADAIAALRQENESLRAQCGLRQIQGYHEGKQRAEADNAALRQALAELVACDDIVKHRQHTGAAKVHGGRWKAAWEAARAAMLAGKKE